MTGARHQEDRRGRICEDRVMVTYADRPPAEAQCVVAALLPRSAER